jgi:tol-pal system protein YbgF
VKKLYLLSCTLILPACSSLTPVNDPVYLRITDVEARLIRIERVLENESLIALAGDISALRSEVQSLLGEVETLGFELENQAAGNRDLYLDLDGRLSNLTDAQARQQSMPSAAAGGAGAPVAAATDQQAYDAAFAMVSSRDYAQAQVAFERFLTSYPASQLRGNAQYWLAETYYAQLEFAAALAEFQRVINNYPQSAKLPDALLKIGYCNDELGNPDAARQALMQVVRQFEGTSAADLAEARLTQLAR